MSTSRRDFLKSSIIAGAGVALSGPAASASTTASEPTPLENTFAAAVGAATGSPGYTRGIGLYPGAPAENFSPELVIDSTTYRDLALLRPAYHSSSYDYNLTAQLVTDGLKDTTLPTWISTSASGHGTFSKTERETLLDHFHDTTIDLRGNHATAQIRLGGGAEAPSVDRIRVFVVMPAHTAPDTLTFAISTSDDGRTGKRWAALPADNRSPPTLTLPT